ncbi:DoxX family protein [uncultured Imperialibacter sp.]|uniref:DoxX family protein n=1 Tax=uncultured Imperialibacter sp. TaxID=1672639 RepID=UPI0030DCC76A|tara:strand:+ start:240 stop:623 length:384 start_codon:yes stop_codon:yes gene_type:complete
MKKTVYWVSTTIVALAFTVTGLGNLLPMDHIAHDMATLGYPAYFLYLLGTWKLLGAATIILPGLPRLKEWAYAGILFDLTGAAFSRAASGPGLLMVTIPLALVILAMVSWALRPEGRRLQNHINTVA